MKRVIFAILAVIVVVTAFWGSLGESEEKYYDFIISGKEVTDHSSDKGYTIEWRWKSIDSKLTTANLIIDLNGDVICAFVIGSMEEIDGVQGSFGKYDGYIIDKSQDTRITASISYYDKEEQLVTVAIGEVGSTLRLLRFGEYTNNIAKINLAKYGQEDCEEDVLEDVELSLPRVVDGEIRQQNTYTKSYAGNELVTLTSYHANELQNQGTTPIYAKINSHASAFSNYARFYQNLNAEGSYVSSKPDCYTVDMQFISLLVYTDGPYTPPDGAQTINLPFEVYIPVLGMLSFDIPLTLSSCTVTTGHILSNSPTNRVTWSVYNSNCWLATLVDGYNSTNTGGTVKASFTQASSISNPTYQTVRMVGNMRYEVCYIVPVDDVYSEMEVYYYYIWTGNVTIDSLMKLIP